MLNHFNYANINFADFVLPEAIFASQMRLRIETQWNNQKWSGFHTIYLNLEKALKYYTVISLKVRVKERKRGKTEGKGR